MYDIFESPIGGLTVATDGDVITALHIEGDRYFTHVPKEWQKDSTQLLLVQARREVSEYFSGKRNRFDTPVAAVGTDFQKSVWEVVADIPTGSTLSYGDIARKIGKPKAVRAVGTAVGRNPICLIVPCHRVLTGTGDLGGYVAGVDRKRQLLILENSSFTD